jgi:fructose-1,6-bisphosphatase/inositol monophosphatase family enzyme
MSLVDDEQLLRVCQGVADAVADALRDVSDWRPSGGRPGQYAIDLVADDAALGVLEEAGLGVLSEESGGRRLDAELVAVIDPVDGSTNAARGIPWYATSVCVVDGNGPRVALVANQATGDRYHAVRGQGAWRGETRLEPSGCTEMRLAVVGLSGYPRRHFGWSQYRAFGAAALDLCSVAEGSLDAWASVGRAHLGPWDYLGGMLLCLEAGAAVADLDGEELVVLDHGARRAVAAAATPSLLEQLGAGALASRPESG